MTSYPRGDESILLVQPDPETRILAAFMLSRLGYRVAEARTGADAVRIFDENGGCDLVVAESTMPRMSGLDLVEILRSRRAGLRFLFVSARAQKGRRFLIRPFTMSTLAASVRAALDEGAGKTMMAGS